MRRVTYNVALLFLVKMIELFFLRERLKLENCFFNIKKSLSNAMEGKYSLKAKGLT